MSRDAAASPRWARLLGLRPLTARSVIASTLLGASPPVLPVAHLVRVAGLFGINENRARVALSRMVSSGEVETDGDGRYRLVGRLLERQHRQEVSRSGRTRSWSGDWSVVVLPVGAASAAERVARRAALGAVRLAELRDGVWVRPDNLVEWEMPAEAGSAFVIRGSVEEDAVSLAGRLFDLQDWSERAQLLLAALSDLDPGMGGSLAEGFVVSAAVLRHFNADPLLPRELLPASWPGEDLRREYDAWDRSYRDTLASVSPGALPSLDSGVVA